LLEKIEGKISGNVITELAPTAILKIKNTKPTALQLKNQRATEFANRQDSKQYLKTLKRDIDLILGNPKITAYLVSRI
jgi:predicted secreted protein